MSTEPIVEVEVPTVELTKKGTIRKRKPKKSMPEYAGIFGI